MEQRDLIRDEIEQLGKVLERILSAFLGLKAKGNFEQGMKVANEHLQSEVNIDTKSLLMLNNTELLEYLNARKLTDKHVETLSEYFVEIGTEKANIDKAEAALFLNRAVTLLDMADQVSKTLSLDRVNKKRKIEDILEREL